MKRLSEMTHYEILDLEPGASPEDVERAHRLARATYGEDSLATYSLQDEGEFDSLRERIDLAYRVLSDPEQRKVYDADGGSQPVHESAVEITLSLLGEEEGSRPPPEVAPQIEGFEDIDQNEGAGLDGAWLRRSRMRRGVELDQISSVTKISETHLRSIEEENFAELPARVYVRGFVTAYARCIGLDPAAVVPAYMERFSAARPTEGRRRQGRG